MAVSLPPSSDSTDYPGFFRQSVVRSTQHVLLTVQAAGAILSPEARDQALHTLRYALRLPDAWSYARVLLLSMSPKMEQAGFRDEWVPYLEEGVRQSQCLEDAETEAELHLQLGTLYQLLGKYGPARSRYEASISVFEQLKDLHRQAQALNQLAQVARLERRYEEAISLVENAFRLLKKQDPQRAYGYLVLGTIALDKRAWEEAIKDFEQALSLWQQDNNRRMMGRSLTSLGAALRSLGQHDEAAAAYREALDLFAEVQDPIHQANVQMNLGNVYLSLEQPEEALNLYLPAERIFRQVQDQFHLAHVNHNIGLAHYQLQDWEKAKAAYLQSIEQQQEIGNVALWIDTLDGLGLVYLAAGQPQEAIATFEEALRRLAEIEGEPGYEHLYGIVTGHLRAATAHYDEQSGSSDRPSDQFSNFGQNDPSH